MTADGNKKFPPEVKGEKRKQVAKLFQEMTQTPLKLLARL